MKRHHIILGLVFSGFTLLCKGQSGGGDRLFSFLSFPTSPQTAALGGLQIAHAGNDLSAVFQNPALLHEGMMGQTHAAFNSFPAGINNLSAIAGFHLTKKKWSMAMGIHYFNYGTITQTDAAGNIFGSIRPSDVSFQWSIAQNYASRWRYGATIKWILSGYGMYKASALAMDLGLHYENASKDFEMGLVTENMGKVLRSYTPQDAASLPFDIRWGLSKKLAHAPLRLGLNLHHLHTLDVPTNADLNDAITLKDLFRHMVFSSQWMLADRVELSAGFNYLRRTELLSEDGGDGLTGFSMGAGVISTKFQVRFTQTYYQSRIRIYQFGLNFIPTLKK